MTVETVLRPEHLTFAAVWRVLSAAVHSVLFRFSIMLGMLAVSAAQVILDFPSLRSGLHRRLPLFMVRGAEEREAVPNGVSAASFIYVNAKRAARLIEDQLQRTIRVLQENCLTEQDKSDVNRFHTGSNYMNRRFQEN